MSAVLTDAEAASVESWSGKDRTDENFPVGSLLIRPALRRHVHAYYDFARNADDIADSPVLAAEDKVARLDLMEAVLLGGSNTGSPSALALRDSLRDIELPAVNATDLLHAFRQDATKHRYANWRELYEYCRYSAMPVGRHVLDLHGEAPDTHPPSDALCTSLQVLNHLQDGQKDLRALNRCYLPDDLLEQHGASVEDLQAAHTTPGLRRVFDVLLDEVDALNRIAADLPRRVRSRRLRVETGVIVNLARRLTTRLRREDPVARRVKLSKLDAALALAGALRHLA